MNQNVYIINFNFWKNFLNLFELRDQKWSDDEPLKTKTSEHNWQSYFILYSANKRISMDNAKEWSKLGRVTIRGLTVP